MALKPRNASTPSGCNAPLAALPSRRISSVVRLIPSSTTHTAMASVVNSRSWLLRKIFMLGRVGNRSRGGIFPVADIYLLRNL